ncbi:MAG: energy-coupling factor ABC transporter ATP-binding protein [Candidatus Hodarchaeales archaeon]
MSINSVNTIKIIPDEIQPVIEVKSLSFSYSKKYSNVLKDLSFQIYKNQLTVIAGPNGSGKTTLMKHFNGLFMAQNGEILVFGVRITKKNRRKIQKQVGVVFQNPEEQIFFPRVYDDVAFGPRNMLLSGEEVKTRVEQALKEVDIFHLKDRITFNLSFGEKKRLAFAGILAMRPDIIVLDEPTIGIDPWSKSEMIKLVHSLKENRTVVAITHDFELMKIADRIILLKNGRIEGEFSSFEDFYGKEFQ